MAFTMASSAAGSAVDDPLDYLRRLKDPVSLCVLPKTSHNLLKLLFARLPQNLKEKLSSYLFPEALRLMDGQNLWELLVPFVPCRFKNRYSGFEDPLSNLYRVTDPEHCFYLLKIILTRIPAGFDRAKVTNPLLVLTIYFMHENSLWLKLSSFNPTLSKLKFSPEELKSIQSNNFVSQEATNWAKPSIVLSSTVPVTPAPSISSQQSQQSNQRYNSGNANVSSSSVADDPIDCSAPTRVDFPEDSTSLRPSFDDEEEKDEVMCLDMTNGAG